MESEISQTIIDLILVKDFQELTAGEKAVVLSSIPESEYQWYRETMTTAQEAERIIAPQLSARPSDKAKLMAAAFPHKNSVGYRIPIWQAAATILLFSGLTWTIASRRTNVTTVVQRVEVEKPVIQVVHDTIIKPQIATRYLTKTITRFMPTVATSIAKIPSPDANLNTYQITDQNSPKGGNSIVLDSNANMFGFVRL